jgi:hypothetical protein
MSWSTELGYFVTPKSGPMQAMRTLHDVNRAVLDDLPRHLRYQRHWFIVGRALLTAASTKTRLNIMLATDALVTALEIEGWMTLERRGSQAKAHDFPKPPPRPGIDQPEPIMRAAA